MPKNAYGSGGKTHAFLTSETDGDEWSALPPRKEPPHPCIRRTEGWIGTFCTYRLCTVSHADPQTQQHCRAMTFGSHIHRVPQSAAVVRCTAVWTHRDRASTLGRKAAHVHASTNSQSITYQWRFWCFSQTNDSRGPQRFKTSHQHLFSNLFSSSLFTYMFVYQDEEWNTCY